MNEFAGAHDVFKQGYNKALDDAIATLTYRIRHYNGELRLPMIIDILYKEKYID